MARELRQVGRRLRRRPGYTALSVAVLGVGLGVVMFLFGMINSLILQPLPYPHAERLVAVGEPTSDGIGNIYSDQFLQLRGKLHSLQSMGAVTDAGVSIDRGGSGAMHYRGGRMTASILTMLGVKPVLGRGFEAADDVAGAARVVLLGETVWRHDFGADPHVIGRAVRVNGRWATVVGVLPADFGFPSGAEVWLPLRLQPGQHRWIAAVARLAPTAQLAQARVELDAWAGRLQRMLPTGMRMRPLTMGRMSLIFVPTSLRHWAWLMFGAGLMVLLLACINVGNLQAVQAMQRRHELALRSALGGSRSRLMLGVLLESLLLSSMALVLAWLIAQGGDRWIKTTWVATHPGLAPVMHGIDVWVVMFGVVVALLSTLLAGGIPAWQASRAAQQEALRDGSKGSRGGFAG